MGYLCDQCTSAPASIFCVADQLVLCKACDERGHTSSRTARKHERVALQSTSDKPNCDICQDNAAIVFCTEDRALMCRRCDVMVHSANAAVSKHTRHLLTGWVLGLTALPPSGEAASSADTLTADPPMLCKPPVSSANLADVAISPVQGSVKPPLGRSNSTRAGPYRANGTADYEDYGALRTLLGYPTPNPPAPATRKTSARQGKQQQQQQLLHQQQQTLTSSGPLLSGLGPLSGNHNSVQHSMLGPPGGPLGNAGASAGPSSVMLTASELLGMPLGDELSAKDIDAVFMPDTYTALDDFDVDFSSLFAVPDFGPPSSDDSGGHRSARASADPFSDLQQQELGMPPLLDDEDGLVPDIFGAQQPNKRRRR